VSIKKALLLPLLSLPLVAQECVVTINLSAKDGSSTTINIQNKKQCIVNLNIDEYAAVEANRTFEGNASIGSLITLAKSKIGSTYESTKAGPDTFDCSGFVYYVFGQNGIEIPRSSIDQAEIEGEKLTKDELKLGDLVFFDTGKKFKRHVNHVGIFIGNNKFIHASSGGKKVMITSFSEKKFYRNKFLYARRVINHDKSFALNSSIKPANLVN